MFDAADLLTGILVLPPACLFTLLLHGRLLSGREKTPRALFHCLPPRYARVRHAEQTSEVTSLSVFRKSQFGNILHLAVLQSAGSGCSVDVRTSIIMDYSQPFSLLNERLRPPLSPTEQLYSSLSRVQSKATKRGSLLALRRSTSMSEPEDDGEEERTNAEPRPLALLSLKEVREEMTVGSTQSMESGEAKEDGTDEQNSDEPDRPESPSNEGVSPFQRSCMTLPDLINSGRPLGRRRTLGHVNETLKEVRREVELSRRRSIKLKAQVDKLQESREGPGWSRDRDRVTEEVLSILSLLQLMTGPQARPAQPPHGGNRLDDALAQLQDVARKLAMKGTQDVKSKGGSGSEDSALLQQALRDRDEAIEKKKAMEAELLRSKTEMMLLNNQLLEAAQKRLELSLELEAWKEDVQLMLNQQLLLQHQVEQSQKKTSRVGILRRNKVPVQRPTNFPVVATRASPPSPASPTTSTTQNFFNRSPMTTAPAPVTPLSPSAAAPSWRDKWKRSNGGRRGEQGYMVEHRENDGFHVVSLD
uniref:bicaudal-D-related protein 2-like n=1 Tax=Doryrhamphus excisus TaxID=161450 RepID=UPI0025AEACDF|nr:bicaudal-D-related protein 2-like [Doryrhamphus excisus]